MNKENIAYLKQGNDLLANKISSLINESKDELHRAEGRKVLKIILETGDKIDLIKVDEKK